MDTFTAIRDIFYSGDHAFRGDADSISEIAFLVREKYLMYDTVQIASKDDYLMLAEDQLGIDKACEAAGGSSTHIALKLLTGRYLSQETRHDVEYESSFCGYFPDVMTQDQMIIAECGHTQNPEKMLVYFKQGAVRECFQVPYPAAEDTVLLGYRFSAGDDLVEFLSFLEGEKRNGIKNLVRGRTLQNPTSH